MYHEASVCYSSYVLVPSMHFNMSVSISWSAWTDRGAKMDGQWQKKTDICGPPGLEFWPHAIPIYIHLQCQELRQDTATWSNTFHSNYQNESARSQGDRIWCVPGSVQNLQWLLIRRFIIVQIYPCTFIEPILRARCSHAACSMLRNSLTIGSPVW